MGFLSLSRILLKMSSVYSLPSQVMMVVYNMGVYNMGVYNMGVYNMMVYNTNTYQYSKQN